jgi:hypothetical protein
MNERIRELAEQAGYKPLGTFADELMEIYNKKFAELIVRECITKAEQEEDRYFEMGEVDLAYALKNFQNLLKQDFGVE